MLLSNAMSLPGRIGKCKSAKSAVSVRRGSTATITTLSGSRNLRCLIRLKITGWQSAVLVPIKSKQLASSISAYELGGPSEPSDDLYPATADAMHNRELVSKLFVPIKPLASLLAT